ncbi:ABC transporter permease [Nocardioides pantholopis]|uniref:ABC transporter permease n=1 Tax=Nocardioides pantholopis TaxID=2483798 RepID=UPI000FDA2DFE|nr:ABC transporter permease [Nocardioides pantholopis]
MIGLAARSVRHRGTSFAATFVTLLLGTALMGSFATLAETAGGPVSAADAETLRIMGLVVGGWGTLIVLFAAASTLGITVRQRELELAALRIVGATPRQARRLVRLETLAVATLASVGGALLAAGGGRVLLALLREGGLVADDVAFAGGPASLAVTAAVVLATGLGAATVAGRRATRGPARGVLTGAATDGGRIRRWQVLLAVVLIGYGLAMAVVTMTVTADAEDPYAAMQTSGSNAILVSVGLALLAPVLLRRIALLGRPVLRRCGVAGQLAAFQTTRRAHQLAGVLGPVVVLSGAATGILMLVGIDDRTIRAAGTPPDDADAINLLNNVVMGMIVVFAAILVVTSFAAAVAHRRGELHRLWLLGATRRQVRSSVLAESAVVAVTGVVLGSLASLATIVPFAVARDEGVVPDGQLWLPPLVAVGTVLLTLASARSAVRRADPVGTARAGALR